MRSEEVDSTLDMIIDFHTHVFPGWLREQRVQYLPRDLTFGELYASPNSLMATAEDLLEAMDEDGIDVSVVMGLGWSDQGLAREVNDYIIDAVHRHPDRLVGFAGVSPTWGAAGAYEVDRCARAGLKGVGELHPDTQRYDLGDLAIMAPIMDVVRQYDLIVTTHSSEPVGHEYHGKGSIHPGVLWRLIQNYPDVTLVCAHWGGGLPFYALMPEVGKSLRNVYFDTAASPLLYTSKVFELTALLVGADRMLLASDYAVIRARRVLAQLNNSNLSEPERVAILGGNATRLLHL